MMNNSSPFSHMLFTQEPDNVEDLKIKALIGQFLKESAELQVKNLQTQGIAVFGQKEYTFKIEFNFLQNADE